MTGIIGTLIAVINFLSLLLIGCLGWFLKSLWDDMKSVRNELTIIQTEHKLNMERCRSCGHEYPG